MRLLLLTLIAGALVTAVAAEKQPAKTANEEIRLIRGAVARAADGAVLRGARVAVYAPGRDAIVVFSDAFGAFEMQVPFHAGVVVKVSKAGYAPVVLSLAADVADRIRVLLDASAALAGQVVDPSGMPVPYETVTARRSNASVEATVAGAGAFSTRTDERGHFRLGGLPAGHYVLTVARSNHIHPAVVEIREGQETYVTAAAEASLDYTWLGILASRMALVAGGVVEGVVRDEFAEPVEAVAVRLWRREVIDGRAGVRPVGQSGVTDDRGHYRITRVSTGRYYLAATTTDMWTATGAQGSHVPVYHPGHLAIENAVAIAVGAGQVARDIDISFVRTRAQRVTGIARDASGRPLSGRVALLGTGKSGLMPGQTQTAPVDRDGTFAFDDVSPGDYVIQGARLGLSSEVQEFGVQRITVSRTGAAPVAVATVPVASISGRISFEGVTLPSQVPKFSIYTERDGESASGEFRSPTVVVAPDLTFTVSGLVGPTRFLLGDAPAGWWLKSVDIAGANAAETPFAFDGTRTSFEGIGIVMSSSAATLRGRVLDAGRRVDAYTVIAFAEDEAQRHPGSSRVRKVAGPMFGDGSFLIHSLPPGRYKVVAVPILGPEELSIDGSERDMLLRLQTEATAVALGEREQRFIELRLADIRE